MANRALDLIKKHNARYVDLRFTDTRGKEQHITIPSNAAKDSLFKQGKMFDGSSIAGWKGIQESDMILMPDAETAFLDPFYDVHTIAITCDILEPKTGKGYDRDPRSIAHRAEAYLKQTNIGDQFLVGPEPEFFLFDDVRWSTEMDHTFYRVDSIEGAWNSKKEYPGGNSGYRPAIKGGYFPTPPVDSTHNIRSEICDILNGLGMSIEAHHHEVATGSQNEIAIKFNSLVKKSDDMQLLKYVVQNVATRHGKTATFMPKPLVGDNGNGMHVHQSIGKNGKNLFAGNKHSGLSELGLYYIGGIIKHARALNAITNASTNSYKRLIPGFEAPTMLAYSNSNRSVAIRLPYAITPSEQHIEVRFPDATGNPYLSFSAMLLAGLDGIIHKIDPGKPTDVDVSELSLTQSKKIPHVCATLQEALECLNKDREFLTSSGVFSNDFLDSYITLKNAEVARLRETTHPVEYDMYYSL